METKGKPAKNRAGFDVMQGGGTRLGGAGDGMDGGAGNDVGALRAAKFAQNREDQKNRGISKESQAELAAKQKRMEDAARYQA